LGFHPAAAAAGVQRWAKDKANSARLHAALRALAAELDATPAGDLIDYDRRRDALHAWSFPADEWHDLVVDLRRRQDARAQLNTSWGDRKRQVASVLVWARVTQGEHRFAPLVLQDRQVSGRSELAQREQTIRWSRTGRPEHHYVALMTALNLYADHLAVRIDSGWDPPASSERAESAKFG
jgi:hypothetical protein